MSEQVWAWLASVLVLLHVAAPIAAGVAEPPAAAAGAASRDRLVEGVLMEGSPPMPPATDLPHILARLALLAGAPFDLERRLATERLVEQAPDAASAIGGVAEAFATYVAASSATPPATPEAVESAAVALARVSKAVAALPPMPAGVPSRIDAAPAFVIDLAGTPDVHAADYWLVIDLGGDDAYKNNAGGNRFRSALSCATSSTLPPAAALIDAGGDDTYLGGSCGTVGGGYGGSGFLLDAQGNDTYLGGEFGTLGGGYDGFGFLVDLGGNDAYNATGRGANGGGAWMGRGFLLDAWGDDHYTSGSMGTNGGGAVQGVGTLADLAGNDTYVAGWYGTNGGGFEFGAGSLLDDRGNDVYRAGGGGANGGGAEFGVGLLVDLCGDDLYEARSWGVNGNPAPPSDGVSPPMPSLLLDADGRDVYADDATGRTVDSSTFSVASAGGRVDGSSGAG